MLNEQNSSWSSVHAGVPQGAILGPLLFLIYVNDLSDNLTSNAKLFAGDTSLLENDQWKMSFNLDPSKHAQKVVFSCKSKRLTHPPLVFNNINVS